MIKKLSAGLCHSAAGISVRFKGFGRCRAIVAEDRQGMEPIFDISRTVLALEDVAFREQGSKVAGQGACAMFRSRHQHVAKAWVGRKLGHFPAKWGDVPLVIQGAKGQKY